MSADLTAGDRQEYTPFYNAKGLCLRAALLNWQLFHLNLETATINRRPTSSHVPMVFWYSDQIFSLSEYGLAVFHK